MKESNVNQTKKPVDKFDENNSNLIEKVYENLQLSSPSGNIYINRYTYVFLICYYIK